MEQSPPDSEEHFEKPRAGGGALRALVLIVGIGLFGLVAFIGWTHLYTTQLEVTPPSIEFRSVPRGVGVAPVSLVIGLHDSGAGLDEVVVRTRQGNYEKEILRRNLGGKFHDEVILDFAGSDSGLEEGKVNIEVRAFDRSFWNNAASRSLALTVDYRKPRLEVLTSQHNAREGGSQLVFYRASDPTLAISGVRVNGVTFPGFPARGLDSAFEDRDLFAAIYAIDFRSGEEKREVRLFAEDAVGNTTSISFHNRVQKRRERNVAVEISEEMLGKVVAPLVERNLGKIAESQGRTLHTLKYRSEPGGIARLREQFAMMSTQLWVLNDVEVASFLSTPRFERLWDGPFMRPPGSILSNFGDRVTYRLKGDDLGAVLQAGYEILPSRGGEVLAANAGIVTMSENFGVYGRTIGIDHGFGLFSVYSRLEQAFVKKGESVSKGQRIARAGGSGFSRGGSFHFEMRVHGIPVAPEEWWEKRWYYDHVLGKINEVKQLMGIPAYVPVEP